MGLRLTALLAGFALALPHAASAQRDAAAREGREVREAARLLDGPTFAEVRQGIEALGLLGSPAAVEPLAARIRRGLPSDLLGLAVDTLAVLAQPAAGPILFELVNHRREDVRLRVIAALAAARPRGAAQALVTALGDASSEVRSAAARGLGELGAREAVPSLVLALERGTADAAGPLGQLLPAAETDRLSRHLGRMPFAELAPGLGAVLRRADVTARTKLELVARLQELATGEVKAFLVDTAAAMPASAGQPDPVRRAIEEAAQRIVE